MQSVWWSQWQIEGWNFGTYPSPFLQLRESLLLMVSSWLLLAQLCDAIEKGYHIAFIWSGSKTQNILFWKDNFLYGWVHPSGWPSIYALPLCVHSSISHTLNLIHVFLWKRTTDLRCGDSLPHSWLHHCPEWIPGCSYRWMCPVGLCRPVGTTLVLQPSTHPHLLGERQTQRDSHMDGETEKHRQKTGQVENQILRIRLYAPMLRGHMGEMKCIFIEYLHTCGGHLSACSPQDRHSSSCQLHCGTHTHSLPSADHTRSHLQTHTTTKFPEKSFLCINRASEVCHVGFRVHVMW